VAVLLAGTIPVMTFIIERHISHQHIESALPPIPRRSHTTWRQFLRSHTSGLSALTG
jgi:hypothetical protein